MFSVSAALDAKALEQIFRHKVLKMLLAKEKITRDIITLLDKWRHIGFNVFSGPRILPQNEKSMENLARYIIRASFSKESPPWCDPFAYRRFRLCIMSNLVFQVKRIGDRSGPGDDLPSENRPSGIPLKGRH